MAKKEQNQNVLLETARRGDGEALRENIHRFTTHPYPLPAVKTFLSDFLRFVGEIRDKSERAKVLESVVETILPLLGDEGKQLRSKWEGFGRELDGWRHLVTIWCDVFRETIALAAQIEQDQSRVKELLSLTRAFRRWFRLSFEGEPGRVLVPRLIEKFVYDLHKLIRKIKRIEAGYWKAKAVETLSHLMEAMHSTRDLGEAIKHLERILSDFERISEDQAMVKRLGDIINLLAELPKPTASESPPASNRNLSPKRKKRGGCVKDRDRKTDESKETKPTDDLELPRDDITIKEPGDKGPGGGVRGTEEQKKKTEEEVKLEEEKESKKEEAPSEKISPVMFRAHWPPYTMPKLWTDLLVYLYSGKIGEEGAVANLTKRIGRPEKWDFDTLKKPVDIKQGTEILIVPKMPGFLFNPSERKIIWYEDWYCLDFRMQPLLEGNFLGLGEKVKGQVEFYVEKVLIGEINIDVIIRNHLTDEELGLVTGETNRTYRKVFVSYSREDEEIIEKLETWIKGFGDKPLRDVNILLSGDPWEESILNNINQADIFQLCWSKAAKKSKYVEKEWEYAHDLKGKKFIRPIYWKKPMPEPPPELADIHFTLIKI